MGNRFEQTLDDFSIGDKVSFDYRYGGGWFGKWLVLTGAVVGFTKHQVRVEFVKGQLLDRRTVLPTKLSKLDPTP